MIISFNPYKARKHFVIILGILSNFFAIKDILKQDMHQNQEMSAYVDLAKKNIHVAKSAVTTYLKDLKKRVEHTQDRCEDRAYTRNEILCLAIKDKDFEIISWICTKIKKCLRSCRSICRSYPRYVSKSLSFIARRNCSISLV